MPLKLIYALTFSLFLQISYAQITEHQIEELVIKGAPSMDEAYAKIDSLLNISSKDDPMYDGLIMLRLEYGRKLGKLQQMNADIDYAIAQFEKEGEFFGEKAPPTAIADMLNYKAINLKTMGMFDSAEVVFKQAIAINLEHELLYNNLANTLILNKKYQEALDILALDKFSETLENVSYLKADAYYNLGEIDSATIYIQEYFSTQLVNKDFEAHLLYAEILLMQNKNEEACKILTKGTDIYNNQEAERIEKPGSCSDLNFWNNRIAKIAKDMEVIHRIACKK
ncbi:MAG: hypothetical protein RLZZ337_1016 [Bacteroidota bacterium]|jgi:Flp pilus assembly protein TadD